MFNHLFRAIWVQGWITQRFSFSARSQSAASASLFHVERWDVPPSQGTRRYPGQKEPLQRPPRSPHTAKLRAHRSPISTLRWRLLPEAGRRAGRPLRSPLHLRVRKDMAQCTRQHRGTAASHPPPCRPPGRDREHPAQRLPQ